MTAQKTKRLCPQDFMVDRPLSASPGYLTRRFGVRPAKSMYKGMGYNWIYRNNYLGDRLSKTFGEIHYLTEHAPEKVQRRWKQAKVRWSKRMSWWKSGINHRL